MSGTKKILVIGCLGQVGSELTEELRNRFGNENVIGSDIREPEHHDGLFEVLDVLDQQALLEVINI